MISITPTAKEQLSKLFTEHKIENWGLVLGVDDIHCAGLHYEVGFRKKPLFDDEVLNVEGINVFINKEYTGFFEDIVLDWTTEGISSGLVIINNLEQEIPKKGCGTIHGCGCSAKVKIEGSSDCNKC